MKLGPKLTLLQQQKLCKDVTFQEIQDALFNIDSNKTPGMDCNMLFQEDLEDYSGRFSENY